MARDFVPNGYLTLRRAAEYAAKLMFGYEAEDVLTAGEFQRLSSWEVDSERRRRQARNSTEVAEAERAPRDIADLTARYGRWKRQVTEAKSQVRQLLYAQTLEASALTDHGNSWPVPHTKWASKDFENIWQNGVAKFVPDDPYATEPISGRVMMRISDLDRVLGPGRTTPATEGPILATAENSSDVSTPRSKGGRPEKYRWDDIWIEICRIVHDEGIPSTQAELRRRVLDWSTEAFGTAPDDATLKPKVRALYKTLKADEN